MLRIPAENIHVKGVASSGCYGHNGADDVAADAALMAKAFPGKHIYVQWSRDDEHAWEPYGSAMLMDLEASLYGDLIDPVNGAFNVPQEPGLGPDPNPDVIKTYAAA